ncbi:hypothetical protein Maes01_01755 [Microbulbifer aestuariivivens]|uniref:NRDE family protein n=1 Tax=Microbulbifer aestuariivivens TaxID=1908308 RepID=A0ABP9WSX1_9GAMM
MCLLLFAYHCHPDYPLLMLANRDEFYGRPTASAAPWDDGSMVAGRDLQGGGTWAGIAPGRVAAVTNIREADVPSPPQALSRGDIPRRFLQRSPQTSPQSGPSPLDYAERLERDRYRGFNALLFQLGARDELVCAGNRHQPFRFAPGIHGISNGAPDAPWPKVERGRAALAALINGRGPDFSYDHFVEQSMALLRDDKPAPRDTLPFTGVGPALEKALSPIFVRIESAEFARGTSGSASHSASSETPYSTSGDNPGAYGTRASTVIAVHRDGTTRLWEQTYQDGRPAGPIRHFSLPGQ